MECRAALGISAPAKSHWALARSTRPMQWEPPDTSPTMLVALLLQARLQPRVAYTSETDVHTHQRMRTKHGTPAEVLSRAGSSWTAANRNTHCRGGSHFLPAFPVPPRQTRDCTPHRERCDCSTCTLHAGRAAREPAAARRTDVAFVSAADVYNDKSLPTCATARILSA
jgi:hypothetical protein